MTTKIRGVALAPGVSANGRYYSPAAIAGAVERAQSTIQAGRMLMKTHHAAEDDTSRVVGRVTSMTVGNDGAAHFTGELADTAHARTIAALVKGPRPFVDGVSIRGQWVGKIRKVQTPDGTTAEAGDALWLDGVDFTTAPGVEAARVVAESYGIKPKRFVLEDAPGPVTAAPELTAADLAKMPYDELMELAGAELAQPHEDFVAARRQSPFMRGLGQFVSEDFD